MTERERTTVGLVVLLLIGLEILFVVLVA